MPSLPDSVIRPCWIFVTGQKTFGITNFVQSD
jgi:hypothetical protein